jgi:hypothetical protein
MKLKILVKLIEKLLGVTVSDDQPRADMFLPERLLAMAVVFLALGIACGVFAIFRFVVWAVLFAAFGIVFGIFALLCWKNQCIHVISDEQFTYTTMFGNTYTYSFADIQGLRKNQDSMTLLVANKKVHIESMAILTDRLVDRINAALEAKN